VNLDQTDDDLPVTLLPPGWPRPKGYANGMAARGRIVVTGGVIGWNERQELAEGFLPQLRQTLLNIRAILAEAGAGPQHLVRLTWYVTDITAYAADPRGLGRIYIEVLGAHFPAMAVIQVVRLVEPDAMIEIEATAVLPE
jgi:enamine deaminase RidA (YjgF/YER057c/UK114 family)